MLNFILSFITQVPVLIDPEKYAFESKRKINKEEEELGDCFSDLSFDFISSN